MQNPSKEASHEERVLEEEDDDEIEALDNEGVGDEIEEDDDEVRILQFVLMCETWSYPKQM